MITWQTPIGKARALKVKAEAIAKLDEREAEFLGNLLGTVDIPVEGKTLDELRALYADEDNYDKVWFEGSLADDNARHEADDYYKGYVAGAAMVLGLLHKAFEITPD